MTQRQRLHFHVFQWESLNTPFPCVSMRANRILPLGYGCCAFLLYSLAQSLFERDFAAPNTLYWLISTPYTLLFIGYLIGLTQRRNAMTSLLVNERMGRNVAVFMLPFGSAVHCRWCVLPPDNTASTPERITDTFEVTVYSFFPLLRLVIDTFLSFHLAN